MRPAAAETLEPTYSTAFERLVEGDGVPPNEDLVGLLAYAFYKRDKRELIISDRATPDQLQGYHAILTPSVRARYREHALMRLEDYGERAIEHARPEIEEWTRKAEILAARDRIIEAVRASTSWRTIVLWNVVAWLLTLTITFLVALGFGAVTVTIDPG